MWSLIKSRHGEGVPIVVWPLAIVGLLAVVGFTMLGMRECRTKLVTVPKAKLPPAHLITPEDLKTRTVSTGDVGDSDPIDTGDLVGHVTTTTIAKEELVPKDGVTVTKPAGYDGLVPAAFHADSATAGKFQSGEWVRLSFAPNVDSSSVKPLSVDAVLLSTNESESGKTGYVVAVCEADRTAMLRVVARAWLMVTPRP